MRETRVQRWSARLVMAGAVVAVLFPLAWVLRVATKTEDGFIREPASLVGEITLANFAAAWSAVDLGGAIRDSLSITIPGALLATVVGTLAGYAFAKLRLPVRRLLMGLAVGGLTIPVAALVVPQFDQALDLGYLDTHIGLIVVYGSFFASWTTLFFYSFFRDLPDDLLEAAAIDGATARQGFRRIALPLAAPAVAVGFVLNLFLQWSELLLGLIMLPSGDVRTAMTAVASFSTQFRTGGPLTAAAAIIVAIPVFLLFIGAQRWLRAEIFGGSIKG